MLRFKTKLYLSLLLSIITFSSYAQDKNIDLTKPELVGISSDSLRNMDAYFHQLVDNQQLAGIQTAVMRNGKLVHFDSYGYSNIQEEILLDQGSIFRIFSMTKPIVSAALMQLYDQGKFKLEDPLSKYIPEFEEMEVYTESGLVPAQNPIRIVDILTHTSGFSYGTSQYAELNQRYASANLFSSENNEEFVRRLSQLPLQFEPGTDWQYGLSTNICGYLVEVLSGMSLDAYLQEHIFSPLGMTDTHFQLPSEKTERFTVGYGWRDDIGLTIEQGQRENRYTQEVTLFNGGGGLVSTTLDYLKFCQMILNKGKVGNTRILEEQTVNLMLKDHIGEARTSQERLRLPRGEAGFSLGFAIRGNNGNELEHVFGWGGAVGTYFKIDTDNNLVYIMMIQLSPHMQLELRQLLQNFVDNAVIQ